MITTRPQTAPITTIPQEVAEAIVLALADSPLSVSAVAKTCLWFNTLIYQATDDHLWRELFLALYDDPRDPRSVGIPTAITSSFCWRTAYQQRAWVSRRLQALNEGSKSKQPSPTAPFLTHDHSFAIILSIFDTALPIRSTILPGISPVPHYFRDAQPLHPLIVAHQETPKLPSADKLTHCTQSKNIQELSKISLRGFQRLLEEYDLVDRRSVLEWRSVQRVQDACKYITTCGWPSSLRRRPAGPVNEEERLIPRFLPLFTSAHKKVFNMNYLTLQGTRGPFIPLNTSRTTDLKPDWIHLAAVRLITQEAITTYLSIDHHPLFGGGNYLRRGAWVPPYSCDGTTHDRYERDWAGVEGVWR